MAFTIVLKNVTIRVNLLKVFSFLIGFVIANFIMSKIFLSDIFINEILFKKLKTNDTYEITHDLFNEVKILCLIMTRPATHKAKAIHVKNTWGKRCNKLLFLTTKFDPDLDTIVIPWRETRKSLRRKTKLGFLHAHDNYLNDYDYFLKADDDSYVIVDNLRYMLYQYRTNTSLFFGHRFSAYYVEGFMAGGAYILSRKALVKFEFIVRQNPRWFTPDGAAEDVCMGLALTRKAIFVDERDEMKQGRFFPVYIEEHMKKTRGDYWYFEWLYYDMPQGGLKCCSDLPIQFHYIKASLLYFHEYLIYQVHPFGISKNLTETLPRKLSLNEIIAASDSKKLEGKLKHTDEHEMTSSEFY